ncbi:MAG: class I SAM-dependent methyltransferase [Rhabdochlamydiaceae bacterium]|nr:class I SAM-dependent methyltransferase [Rhabdochlamydiaceae bacterium]
MDVIKIAFQKSSGVEKEIEVWERDRQDLLKAIESCQDPNEYIKGYIESANGMEFLTHVARFAPNQKVLDIGFGHGETSLFLALQGHEVISLDPSPIFCELLNGLAQKFSLPIRVYQSTGEAIDQIPETAFDACIFTASLHHCDSPLHVLKLCHAKLKKGGKVLLINEPLLKFYRSKKWYQHMLEFHPEKVGHYGGNEHIYFYREYLKLLEDSGYSSPKDFLHLRLYHPRVVIRDDLTRQVNGQYCISDLKSCIKFIILLTIKNLIKYKFLSSLFVGPMKRLSLIPVSFEAIKN